jgi:hypothetical protein
MKSAKDPRSRDLPSDGASGPWAARRSLFGRAGSSPAHRALTGGPAVVPEEIASAMAEAFVVRSVRLVSLGLRVVR